MTGDLFSHSARSDGADDAPAKPRPSAAHSAHSARPDGADDAAGLDLLGAPLDANKRYDGVLAGQGAHPPLDDWIPPLMALWNAQGGQWKSRKKAWRALIPTAKGRAAGLLSNDMTKIDPHFYDAKDDKERELGRPLSRKEFVELHYDRSRLRDDMVWGTSRFDPVLAECIVRCFTAPGDTVVDPFAGGVERAYVAAALGRHYVGIELRQEQIDENLETLAGIRLGGSWRYVQGDSADPSTWEQVPANARFAFTCPPYHDLEKYGGGPADLSGMTWDGFLAALGRVWGNLAASLAANACAAMVVGDLRDKRGDLRSLAWRCAEAMRPHGFGLANEITYLSPIGSKRFTGVKPYKGRGTMIVSTERVVMGRKGDRQAWFKALRNRGGGVKRDEQKGGGSEC